MPSAKCDVCGDPIDTLYGKGTVAAEFKDLMEVLCEKCMKEADDMLLDMGAAANRHYSKIRRRMRRKAILGWLRLRRGESNA